MFGGILFATPNDTTSGSQPSILYPTKLTTPPKIDGYIEDREWGHVLKSTDFKTNMPDYGKTPSVPTEVYYAYDEDNLYFAFRCIEKDASKIKTSLAGRDQVVNDDWICVNLDTFGDMQSLNCFYVNPSGIQMDSYANRTNENFKYDALWECESIVDGSGYTVELRVPLKSLRFSENNPVEMRVLMQRNIPLRNEQVAYPPMNPASGSDWLTQTIPLRYEGLKHHTLFEVLPALTYQYRETDQNGRLVPDEKEGKLSITTKYGITQDLVLDATYKPDFSQIEADAGQVDVNLRYELYYPEARPFFLEGADNFLMATGPRIIHTRKIVNPVFGAKLNGKIAEGQTIAFLYAKDDFASIPNQTSRYADYGIARYKADIGNSSYLGSVLTGKRSENYFNGAGAVDGYVQLWNGTGLSLFGSVSKTDDKINNVRNDGNAFTVGFREQTRDKGILLRVSRVSENYDSETGLMDRTGILRFTGQYQLFFYPESTIFNLINPIIRVMTTRDDPSDRCENNVHFGLGIWFTNRILTEVDAGYNTEIFLGKLFKTDYLMGSMNYQITGNFGVNMFGEVTNAIYYDADPYQGYSYIGNGTVVYQPLDNINVSGSLTYSDFYRKIDRQKIYDYLISRFKTTYQFNKYLFFRGIVEHNSYYNKLVMDFLLSYTYIPGTVVYLGYGSLYQKIEWRGSEYFPTNTFHELKRGLFAKVSYNWRY